MTAPCGIPVAIRCLPGLLAGPDLPACARREAARHASVLRGCFAAGVSVPVEIARGRLRTQLFRMLCRLLVPAFRDRLGTSVARPGLEQHFQLRGAVLLGDVLQFPTAAAWRELAGVAEVLAIFIEVCCAWWLCRQSLAFLARSILAVGASRC